MDTTITTEVLLTTGEPSDSTRRPRPPTDHTMFDTTTHGLDPISGILIGVGQLINVNDYHYVCLGFIFCFFFLLKRAKITRASLCVPHFHWTGPPN